MIKYIINTKKESLPIIKVECEIITPLQDPTVAWLPTGEYKAKIVHETISVERSIYYSHSTYNSIDEAKQGRIQMLNDRYNTIFLIRGTPMPSKEEMDQIISNIEIL